MSFTSSMEESWVLIFHHEIMYLSQKIIEIKIKYQLNTGCAGDVEINIDDKLNPTILFWGL